MASGADSASYTSSSYLSHHSKQNKETGQPTYHCIVEHVLYASLYGIGHWLTAQWENSRNASTFLSASTIVTDGMLRAGSLS